MTDNRNRIRLESRASRITGYFIIGLVLFFILFPFYIMFSTSFMTKYEANDVNYKLWSSAPSFTWYKEIILKEFGGYSAISSFITTFAIYIPSSIVGVLVSAMAAFAFAKMRFPFKGFIFTFLMGTMLIPNNMSIIISYSIFDSIGWIGTANPLIVPRLFGTIGITFFLRQFYFGVPNELIECGKIDGVGWFGIFFKIMLPISIPVLSTQFILFFIAGYNDYLGPLLYLNNANLTTIQVFLASIEDPYIQNWPLRMTACIITMIPIIVLYLFSQKLILKDVSVQAGIKG